jgi:RimJ/RimL family protein N-acetyltransferase
MEIEYRPATEGDLELLMAWRSHPELYQHFYEQDEELSWDDHLEWWNSRTDRRDWIISIREDSRWRDVGVIALSDLSGTPEVHVWIGEVPLWGNGIATDAVQFAVSWLRKREYSKAFARILDQNGSSQHLFEKVGFERTGPAREGESRYEISLNE